MATSPRKMKGMTVVAGKEKKATKKPSTANKLKKPAKAKPGETRNEVRVRRHQVGLPTSGTYKF